MSNTLVLRRVFATDSNTGLPISTASQVLVTDDKGGTNWIPVLSTLSIYGGQIVGNLPSTLLLISSQNYVNQSNISVIQHNLAFQNPGQITLTNLTSTVAGLGQASYVSSFSLVSTTFGLFNTVQTNLVSSIEGLGESGYISTPIELDFISTVDGLADSGYVSSTQLFSTIDGLGSSFYIKTIDLQSTINGLGTLCNANRNNYISSSALSSILYSTVVGLGSFGRLTGNSYVSTLSLQSTVVGLGSFGRSNGHNYISTLSLVSTTIGLSTIQSRITFTNVGTCLVRDSQVYFSSVNQLIFLSSFYYSSVSLMPSFNSAYGTTLTGQSLEPTTMSFSSASFNLSSFSNYIVSSSRLSLELYPTFLFSRLANGATAPGIFTMSTLIQVGNDFLSTLTTSVVVAQTQNLTNSVAGSNVFNQVIRIEIPPSSIVGDYTRDCTLFHYLPNSVNYDIFKNGVENCNYSYYFGRPGAFLTVQNSQEY
jgi:hypothetical protein